jgi:hypothetical protein
MPGWNQAVPKQCCSICLRQVDWDTIEHWLVAPFICPSCRYSDGVKEAEQQLEIPGVEPSATLRTRTQKDA